MTLALPRPFPPMEALSVDEIPQGENWQYEPKWDGFRCLIFRDGGKINLQSKSGQSLTRYFPELVAAVGHSRPRVSRSMVRSSCRTDGRFPSTTFCSAFTRPRAE